MLIDIVSATQLCDGDIFVAKAISQNRSRYAVWPSAQATPRARRSSAPQVVPSCSSQREKRKKSKRKNKENRQPRGGMGGPRHAATTPAGLRCALEFLQHAHSRGIGEEDSRGKKRTRQAIKFLHLLTGRDGCCWCCCPSVAAKCVNWCDTCSARHVCATFTFRAHPRIGAARCRFPS